MWGGADAFRFAWTRVSGDASLTATVVFPPGNHPPNEKAVLIFRQSLDPGSPYADIAIHADGTNVRMVTDSLTGPELAALWQRNKLVHSLPVLRAAVMRHLDESFVAVREAAARHTGLDRDDFAIRIFAGAMQGIWMTVYFQWGDRGIPEMVGYMARAMELAETGLPLNPASSGPRPR